MTELSSYDLIHYVELLPMSIVFLLKSFGNTDVFTDFEMKNYERGFKRCTTCGAIFLTVIFFKSFSATLAQATLHFVLISA